MIKIASIFCSGVLHIIPSTPEVKLPGFDNIDLTDEMNQLRSFVI
jgi:hypothetical protein